MKGLLVREPWIDLILDGKKTWELRGQTTAIRGKIALIRSRSGYVEGTVELVDVIGPLSKAELKKSTRRHRVDPRHFQARAPMESLTPRKRAAAVVAVARAALGVSPASTMSSSSRWLGSPVTATAYNSNTRLVKMKRSANGRQLWESHVGLLDDLLDPPTSEDIS